MNNTLFNSLAEECTKHETGSTKQNVSIDFLDSYNNGKKVGRIGAY